MAATSEMPHLPPGHPPGPQSRRGRAGVVASGCALPLVVGLAVVFGLTLGVVGLGVIGAGGGAYGAIPLVLAVVIVVGLGAVARAIWRGARPRFATDLAPTVALAELRRGGEVRVDLPLPAGAAGVEVGLVCRVRYDIHVRTSNDSSSGSSRRTRSATCREAWTPAAGAGVVLRVPADAPCSYEGEAVSFDWSVRARHRGQQRTSAPVPVWVAP